ncbi:hypothetical protein CJ030_MR3G001926 [Morella rubra]|uniref:Uncharacterized protein n=1 Tax=Morella rubra TaxID=262757 RepID=A0A6A1W7H8_9ROSI|nr:hypothetical protein CJ030_MR3G001926 [Morella rubra]
MDKIIEMNKRLCITSQADAEEYFGPALLLDEHTAVIMSCLVVVEWHIQLANFYELRFKDRTLLEIVEQAGWLPFLHRTGHASKNLVREFYASILRARDLEEPSMEVTVRNVQIIFSPDELSLFLGYCMGLHVDMASFIYQSVRAEALKTDAQISLPYGVLLTQFLHNLILPEGADEPRALPLGSINKTTLSKSMDECWPTHEMVGSISSWLAALELKVVSMDVELKKQVFEVQLALKGIATSAELVALTERVVLLEERMSDVWAILHLSDD